MIENDVLLTLAELAVGLIGVSGIVAVFLTKGRLHSADQLRFISIVVNGMLVVVFALVPIWTNSFIEDDESLWRFSSSAGLIITFLIWPPLRLYAVRHPEAYSFNPGTYHTTTVIAVLSVALVALNVIGWPLPPNGVFYQISLLGPLVQVGILFASLVVVRPEASR